MLVGMIKLVQVPCIHLLVLVTSYLDDHCFAGGQVIKLFLKFIFQNISTVNGNLTI